jgi:ABC-type transport system involved in multi-copper enzyme maturation permease subunit
VFVATLIGNFLSSNNSLIAAIVATLLFATLYICAHTNFSELLSSMWRRMAR